MLFSEIIGQEDLKRRLIQMVQSGNIPHAQLFGGREGTGKLALALATAQYMCCKNRGETDSCGTCSSCVKFSKLAHPDLHLVFPIVKNASKGIDRCDSVVEEFRKAVTEDPYISVDEWLGKISDGKSGLIYANEGDEIIRKLSLKSYESPYKIMLIWAPEKMHESCANHVLKIIEEPPENTVFFLVSDHPEEVLGTIVSRTQRVSVPPIDDEDMSTAIKQRYDISDEEIHHFVRLSSGSWNRLQRHMTQNDLEAQQFDDFKQMMRLSWTLNVKEIRQWVDRMATLSREQQKQFLQKSQNLLRENFIMHFNQPELNYMSTEEESFSNGFSKFITNKNINEMVEELALAENQIGQNVNSKMVFFDTVLQLYKYLKKY